MWIKSDPIALEPLDALLCPPSSVTAQTGVDYALRYRPERRNQPREG